LPDQEAIEVALEDLSDVSDSEPSTETEEGLEQPEQLEADAAEQQAEANDEGSQEQETKSQRRRRLRREREQKTNDRVKALEAENARLKTKADRLKAPNPQQYTSEAEYQADLAAYKVRKQDIEDESERINQDYSEAEQEDGSAYSEAITDFQAEGSAKYKDFRDVISRPTESGGPAFTTIMTEALFESDIGIDVAYELAKNPQETYKIAKLSPVAQAKAIFEAEAKVKAKQVPPKSKAPAPVKPVRGGSSAAQSKPVSEMSMAEYAAYRQKQMEGQS
jgi:hypothetical protein